jgi:translocation and assembly module TamA
MRAFGPWLVLAVAAALGGPAAVVNPGRAQAPVDAAAPPPLRPAPAPRSQIVQLDLPTDEAGLAPTLRAGSLLFAAQAEGRTSAQDLFAAAQADYARLLAALYARGHYGPSISIRIDGREASEIGPFEAPARIARIAVAVTPGPAFGFGRLEVAPLAPRTELPEGFAAGQPALSPRVGEAADAAIAAWRAAGHPRAAVASRQVTAEHGRARLNVDLRLEPGRQARFGTLRFAGTTRVPPARLAKIAGFPTGRTFSPRELDQVSERLRRTGVFRAVSLREAAVVNPDGTLDVEVTLADQPLRRLGFGAEISNGEGLDLSAYLLNRNLLGGAERLRIDAGIGHIAARSANGVDYRLGLGLDRPATITPDTTLGFSVDLRREDDGQTRRNILGLEGRLSHILSHLATLRAGIAWAYEASGRTGVPPDQQTTFRTLALPLGVTWDRRDNRLDPRRGHLADAEIRLFRSYSGSDDQGMRLSADLRGYRALGDRLVLAGRLQGGAVLGARWALTPRDYLFRSGGAGTVRGQPYQSLAEPLCRALLPDTCSVGGTHFLGASLEARAAVRGKIGAVAFADYGRIGVDGLQGPSARWHAGAGLGLRYDTGIGPIRLDIARPLGRGDTRGGTQIYIGIGQAF